ncbi:DUF257 family protein [Thermococcus sp.]|uniref:DUF257 family protein n=1 Tax=Thermococcus sp. TaxID=35749 RepID=UPI00260F862E|nr:DUF257 family protein [Thermococcus sp.]
MMELKKPVLTTAEDLEKLIENIKTGGLTIVENSSVFGTEFTLYFFKAFSEKNGIPLVIEDIFDTLPVYATHLKLMGFSPGMKDVNVIKVGGSQEVGNVVGRIEFEEDPNVYQRKLERELEKLSYERYIHLVLGLERLLVFQKGIYNTYTLLNLIRRKLGSRRSKNVYIIERPVVEKLKFNPLPFLEDIATSVVQLSDEEELVKIRFRKSPFTLLAHKGHILISPREIVRWWE